MTSAWQENIERFVGRKTELREVHELLSRGKRQVLVLGPAAIGKTEFARAYMREYARTYSSAAYVRFSVMSGHLAIYPVIAHELGLLPPGSQLDRARMIVAEYLSGKRGLVILDGLDEAPRENWLAQTAALNDLLRISTRSRLLLTSRNGDVDAQLIQNCAVYPLRGLNQSEAADLAKRILPDNALGTEIFSQLYSRAEGNPLVLRLFLEELSRAAFRPEEIEERFERLFAEQWGREISNLVVGVTPAGLRTFAALRDRSVGVLTPTSELVLAAPYVFAQSHTQFWRNDIARFDELLNDRSARESHFQEFFEKHSRLLTGIDYSKAVPHDFGILMWPSSEVCFGPPS